MAKPSPGDPAGIFGAAGVAEDYARFLGCEDGDEVVTGVVAGHLRSPLPDGWQEQVDEKGRLYYWNELTAESTWNHPDHDGLVAIVEFAAKARPIEPWKRRRALRDERLALEKIAREAMKSWSGPHLDPDGNRYYYDEKKGRSEWRNPAVEALRTLIWRLEAMETVVKGYQTTETRKDVFAAVLVQKHWRGYLSRRDLRKHRPDWTFSARIIQRAYRGYRARAKFWWAAETTRLLKRRKKQVLKRGCAQTIIAANWRGYYNRMWYLRLLEEKERENRRRTTETAAAVRLQAAFRAYRTRRVARQLLWVSRRSRCAVRRSCSASNSRASAGSTGSARPDSSSRRWRAATSRAGGCVPWKDAWRCKRGFQEPLRLNESGPG
jgi:hypothetical protein